MMRRSTLAVALAITALAIGNVGFRLAGALRQIGALAGARPASPVRAAYPEAFGTTARAEYVPVASPESSGGVAMGRSAPATEPHTSASEPPSRFDTEAALLEIAERDPGLTELLNDADPAVGDAVRDFLRSLAEAGGN